MSDRKLLNIELGRISAEDYRNLPESGVVVVLDNIRSAFNVGSVFRSADAMKVDEVFLCGICAVPPSPEIHKSALGAEYSVPWRHVEDTMDVVDASDSVLEIPQWGSKHSLNISVSAGIILWHFRLLRSK